MPTKDKVFLDTNVLIYQFDRTNPAKQKRAKELMEELILKEDAVVSSQVVQEFMNVSLKKFDTKLTPEELELVMTNILKPLCAHVPTFDFYERSLKLYMSYSLSFYDALIIQAAIDLGCTTLYSEDLQNGQQFGILRVHNPFFGTKAAQTT